MKCKQLGKIDFYHAGELDKGARFAISRHLENCDLCREYLAALQAQERVISKVRKYKPQLAQPEVFRNEILGKVKPARKRYPVHGISWMFDGIVSILVQPVTRYSFMTAASIIFGIFIYQQTILVQKISMMEKRMESNVSSGESDYANRKNIETFFKKRSGIKADDKEFNELIDDYRLLQIKHRVLLKTLKNNYPETYQDIIKKLEETDFLLENINI